MRLGKHVPSFAITQAFAVAALLAGPTSGRAFGRDVSRYVDERLQVTNVSHEADDLRRTLVDTVRRTLEAGHLNPYFISRGELHPELVFTNAGDVVRSLSAAYPHLPADVRREVVAYLKEEMARYPPWSEEHIAPEKDAASRNIHPMPSFDYTGDRCRRPAGPGLQNVYALWLYAENTGDWETVRGNWEAVRAFYERRRTDARCSFGAMGGLVGASRIARKLGAPDVARRAASELASALEEAEPGRMAAEASKRAGHDADWQGPFTYAGFHLFDLCPEIARAIRDDPKLTEGVVAQTARGTLIFPEWFISQASGFSRYYGESHAITPLLGEMIFPVKAWVEGATPEKLGMWTDAEDAPVGDLYFIKRLAVAIEAHGEREWVRLGY